MAIDYLIIGNVTQDLTPDGPLLGGTALYSAITAQRLGRRVALVTRAPLALEIERVLPGVECCVLPTDRATTFENRYHGSHRTQVIHHVAPPLQLEEIPPEWRRAPIVHLAPIARECDPAMAAAFPNSFVCVTPQGWLRSWNEQGEVGYAPLENLEEVLRPIDVLVFSAEDVDDDPEEMGRFIRGVPIAVVTCAENGAVLYTKDEVRPSPARPVRVVDPTGAGDVFAAAFFSRLYESGDPHLATAFANVVASFSIEGRGIEGIPTLAQVEAWFAQQQK